MRVFSQFEKGLLRKIIELEKADDRLLKPNSFLQGLLKIKSQVTIWGRDHDYELKEGETHYFKIEILGDDDDGPSDYFEVTGKFYEANDLLEYLLKNGFLLRHEGGTLLGLLINRQDGLVEGQNNVKKIDIHVNKPLKEFLEKCAYYYKPTEALRDLVKHNFKTKEERNNHITRIISIVSISISLLGVGLNFYISNRPKKVEPQTIKIDSASIDYYLKKIEKTPDTILIDTILTIPKDRKSSR